MITADFFPTTYTDSSSGYERTNTISSLGNGFSAYWLGWMYYDNIPQSMKVSEISFSESRITAQVINIPQNSPVGYVTDKYDYNVDFTGYIKDTPFTVSSNQSAYTCYLNGMNCMANAREINISTGNESSTYFMIMRETGTDESLGTHLSPISQPFNNSIGLSTLTDIIDFLKGDKTVTLTTTINSVSIPITITADDLNENYYVETMGNANGTFYRICVFIAGYGTLPNYAKSSATGSGSTTWRTISTLKLFTENGNYYVNKNSGCYYTNFYFDSALTSAYSSNKIANIGFLNGFEFTITKSELQTLARYAFTFNGNTCFMLDRDYLFMRMYTPSEILHHLALNIRLQERNTPTYGYHTGIYCPEVLDSGEFTGNLLTGELTEDDVQPWQWYNIKDNDFDEGDIPPYVPPGPTPGGDDNSETGDKIPNQFGRSVGVTSNFITQYLMTQGQISKLGEVLWTSWADDTVTMDMVENFYGKLHDETGSWNVSAALQFLVSCRMFPMSLATLVNKTATTSIPIGTGAFALQCGTLAEPTFYIADSSVAVLNCGDVYIPKEFGDYRDFDNTNITAYLPYCGSVQLSPQDVVGKWLGCTYAIDLFDGSCKAFLYTLSGNDVGYEGAYYNVAIKEGQCGFLIPMSATQAGEVASRRKVDSYVDGSMLFNAGSTMLDGTMRIASGDGLGAIGADVGRLANLGFAYNTLSAQRMGRAGIAAPTIAGGSGFADFMQPASPYIQIRRSRYQMPIQYENSAAYPTNAQNFGNLSQFTGFVQCKNVDVHGFTCHEEERSAIKALLESGVYL